MSLGKHSSRFRIGVSLARGKTATVGRSRSSALAEIVKRWARQTQYKAALASSSALAPYLRIPELKNTPTVFDLIDVDSQKWLDYAQSTHGPRRWLYLTEAKRLRELEANFQDGVRPSCW